MPTILRDLLSTYSEQDLEKLAKDKIEDFEHLRLPKSVLIEELSNLLTSPSYIYETIAFRSPPTFEILTSLLNSPGYEAPIHGFRKTILERTKEYIDKAESGEFLNKGAGYALYVKMLHTAWESEGTVERNEACLLETLREELGLTFKEHCILEHHPRISAYWNTGNPFQRERNHLLQSGIVYVHEQNDTYVLPEEIAYQILTLWEVELDDYDYERLLSHLTKDPLSTVLDHFNLKISGTKEDLIQRIIENHIPARKALDLMQKEDLSDVCKSIGCKSSGVKQEIIDRLINKFRYDFDLESEEETNPVEEIVEEEKQLNEQDFKILFNVFTANELQHLLSQIPTLVTYGIKEEKINRLWSGPYSEQSLLELLNKREIQAACKEFGLPVSGRKEDLIERVIDYFQRVNINYMGIEEELSQENKPGNLVDEPVKSNGSSPQFNEIPHLDQVKREFPFLDYNQQIILASLIEFKSLNEQDIDRIVARYNLGWLFFKPEMNRLMGLLKENGKELIEQHSFEETDRYDLRYEQNIFS